MGHHSIPSPPMEEHHHQSHPRTSSVRKAPSGSKSRPSHRASKRVNAASITAAATAATAQAARSEQQQASSPGSDGRHKRVWKACERCRMKKTKCDGEFPCKRCKDDGLVCTAGVRKKTEYKQLPRGYAEVLESTQFALIATIQKLYAMVRNGEKWELDDPMLNDRGQPIVHNIAHMLGCIRPNSDIDLPVHSVFPEDQGDLEELVRQLKEQEQERERETQQQASPHATVAANTKESANVRDSRSGSSSSSSMMERDSSCSEMDHSEFEEDYRRKGTAGSLNTTTTNTNNGKASHLLNTPVSSVGLLSPQSLPPYQDFEMDQPSLFQEQSLSNFAWNNSKSAAAATTAPGLDDFLDQAASFNNIDMLNQGLLESEFGNLKPHVVSCPNPEVMMGMGDPMMYAGYEDETMRL